MKKMALLTSVVVLSFAMTGCAAMKEKFVPKKKEPAYKAVRYSGVRKYNVKPNLDLYTKRYVFWKNWHTELLNVMRDSNSKKKTVAVEQEISNLMDMRNMLRDEKAEGLTKLIGKMEEVEKAIKTDNDNGASEVRIRNTLESTGRAIMKDYSYTKVGDDLRDDFKSASQ
ncbi:MAG: hypothetical protein HQL30_10980 [Candidatus Omnitrophica bacterium]|nr:hypothetical protein [Candidatus Omnitrophota bacterium]